MVSTAIGGRGTTEVEWSGWLGSRPWPLLDVESLRGRRVCVIAAHPDDEILGAAGLLRHLRGSGAQVGMVWATDGEASHPESTVMSAPQLAAVRRSESRAALGRLGIEPGSTHHLGLPDGGLATRVDEVRRMLSMIVGRDDVVVTTWSGDGHPDHEAVAEAAADLGTVQWQYPIWMWHWARPGDDRVPWDRLRVVSVDDVAVKAAAIAEFASQVRPIGPAPEDAAILPAHVVARFLRPYEWFVV